VRRWWIPAAGALALASVLLGAMVGPAGPSWWRVPLALLDHLPLVSIDSGVTPREWTIIWDIRMPRVVLAALVGSMLSLSGASYQGVFRNPLVDPYLLGVAAGAGLGATLVFTLNRTGSSTWIIDPLPLSAFAGGLLAVLVTYVVGTAFGGQKSASTLVLAGVAVTALATAVQTFVLQRHTDVLPYVVVSSVVLFLHRRLLDIMRVGDDEATALGASVNRVRIVVVIAATLGTSAVVAVSGLIGFVGIIVPHAVRLLAGASYRVIVPLSLLMGASFLIIADIPGRVLQNPSETPIGVVTAFLGAPFFLLLLRTRQGTR
jgi:iron complex transport system permease protein